MFIIYLILEFLAVYIAVKLYSKKMISIVKNGRKDWVETTEFWMIVCTIIAGPFAILCILAWKLLDKLTSKLNLFKDEESK